MLLNRYRPQNYLAWILVIIGFGLFSTITADTSGHVISAYQVIEGIGMGILFASTTFPILAPLKVTDAAYALAFFTFVRSFAQVDVIPIPPQVSHLFIYFYRRHGACLLAPLFSRTN
jgi:hypothetical protein